MSILSKNRLMASLVLATASMAFTATAVTAQEVSFEAVAAWESEYIFRGVQLQQNSFQPSAQIDIDQFYFGAWAALPTNNGGAFDSEIDLFAGVGVPLGEKAALDLGFTYYTYPESTAFIGGDDNTFETFAGFSFDGVLSPSLYAFYDFDLNAFTLEASLSHSWPLAPQFSFDVASHLGGVYASSARGFSYYGLSADISHTLTDNASAALGVRWSGASEDTMFADVVNGVPSRFTDNSVSFGLSLTVTR